MSEKAVKKESLLEKYLKRVNKSDEELIAEAATKNLKRLKMRAKKQIGIHKLDAISEINTRIEDIEEDIKEQKGNIELAYEDLGTDNYDTYCNSIIHEENVLSSLQSKLALTKGELSNLEASLARHEKALKVLNS